VRKSFIGVNDIETGAGYPFQFPHKLHCRTLLVFTYRRRTDLCEAVKSAPRSDDDDDRRRRRRQVQFAEAQVSFDEDQLLLTRAIVAAVVDYQT